MVFMSAEKYQKTADQIKAGFDLVFHRADPEMTKPSVEVVVCHQNVIRSYVCRALQLPNECWLRMGGYNAGNFFFT